MPKPGHLYSKVPPENESYGTEDAYIRSEVFFSDEPGKVRDAWERDYGTRDVKKISLPMGLVELSRLKTMEERSKALVGAPTGYGKKDYDHKERPSRYEV